jgi:hypothetical protein
MTSRRWTSRQNKPPATASPSSDRPRSRSSQNPHRLFACHYTKRFDPKRQVGMDEVRRRFLRPQGPPRHFNGILFLVRRSPPRKSGCSSFPMLTRGAPSGGKGRMVEDVGNTGASRLRPRTGRGTGRILHISMTCEDRRPQPYSMYGGWSRPEQGAKEGVFVRFPAPFPTHGLHRFFRNSSPCPQVSDCVRRGHCL